MDDLITIKPNLNVETAAPQNDEFGVFRSYDIRGIYPEQLDPEISYQIAKAFTKVAPGQKYVLGIDMRSSSVEIAKAIRQALVEEGKNVDFLGLVSTDCFYFAVGKYGYDGGAIVTASHNSAIFNGVKFVKKNTEPVLINELKDEFMKIKHTTYYIPKPDNVIEKNLDVSDDFIKHVLNFSQGVEIMPMKIVVDAGNGMAGEMVEKLLANHPGIRLYKMYFEPNADFPHHEANPAISSNVIDLQEKVKELKADLGVAFDGDGDRVFFVDRNGELIQGYYIQALLSEYFLNKHKGSTVVYDTRYTRAIESVVRVTGGRGVVTTAGHSSVKQKMRQEDAIFGGESTSSHFYFRDNYYADSGLITFEIVLKIISETKNTLEKLIETYKQRFFASGEKNFHIADNDQFKYIVDKLKNKFPDGAFSDFDGVTIDFNDWRLSLRQSNTEPFIRLNVEAYNKNTLEEKQSLIFNIIEQFAKYTGEVSNLYSLSILDLDKKEKLELLYSNLHFTWNALKGNYIDQLYGHEWARNKSPIDVLRQIDQPILDEFYEKNKINIENSHRLESTYLKKETWFDSLTKNDQLLSSLKTNPIAYFSLEFGLADWLQTYSGGLGILAGDTIKEASDSGLPMIAVGLFYAKGYFYQRFDKDGWQIEDYLDQDTDDYPMETVKDKNGYTIVVDVKLGEKIIKVRAWRVKIGRRSLLLLDTNFDDNKEMEDKMITYHLYGGNEDTRIKQEVVLAMGGYKILHTAGITPSIYHLNEGHSAFVVLVLAQDFMQNEGMDFNTAIKEAKKRILFTNHTLKQAGNDLFSYDLVKHYLSPMAAEMGVDFQHIFSLGVDPSYAEGKFGMTILGLNNSAKVNAVSKLHAEAAKSIWANHEMIPVTNGVHLSTWIAEPVHRLLDEYVGEKWNEQSLEKNLNGIDSIPNNELWNAHVTAKKMLLDTLRHNCEIDMNENALILGWFRRLTAYKQPEILTMELDRLEKLINNNDRPIRFVFGGKAHPRDEEGKKILQEMYRISLEPRFKGKLVLVPDYNWRMARFMISGSDVWINSPIRLQEACGTSGMKAAANGVMQFSTIDGWIDEIKDEKVIWPIQENLDSNQYYNTIENEIIPLYWQRNEENIPNDWVLRMKATMKIAISRYGTDRMIRDYIEILYRPILKSIAS